MFSSNTMLNNVNNQLVLRANSFSQNRCQEHFFCRFLRSGNIQKRGFCIDSQASSTWLHLMLNVVHNSVRFLAVSRQQLLLSHKPGEESDRINSPKTHCLTVCPVDFVCCTLICISLQNQGATAWAQRLMTMLSPAV